MGHGLSRSHLECWPDANCSQRMMLLRDNRCQTHPWLAYQFSTGLQFSYPCYLESQWVQNWRMGQNCGCVLEGSLAGCLGWRNEETGWLVLNDLNWQEEMETMESLQKANTMMFPGEPLRD